MTQTNQNPSTGQVEGSQRVLTGVAPQRSPVTDQPTDAAFSVSIPQVGAYRTADHRYYWNGKGPVPSVTTILKVLDKPALVQWAKRTVAEMAVNRYEDVGTALFGDEGAASEVIIGPGFNWPIGEVNSEQRKKEVIRWLSSLPDYKRDIAADLGSSVHLLADMAARGSESVPAGFQVSAEEMPYLVAFRGFLGWLSEHGTIISSEKMVWADEGYAGTYDLLVRFTCDCHSGLWLLDIKTSKQGTYPEFALQLIAYGYADWIIVEDNPKGFPMPKVQRYGILHLRPELYADSGWRLIEYPLIPDDYLSFLGALEVFKFKQRGRYTKATLMKSPVL